jgi:hypothetical protein
MPLFTDVRTTDGGIVVHRRPCRLVTDEICPVTEHE